MNRTAMRRLLASAPAPRAYSGPPAAPAPADPPPVHWREGSSQSDWAGGEIERRNVAHLRDSIGFTERDAAIARALGYDRPEYFEAIRARYSAPAEVKAARAAARAARIKRFKAFGR